jgi:hypothetical protein
MPDQPTAGKPPGAARQAAIGATRHYSLRINFEGLGTVTLPPADELAFLGGIGVLAIAGLIEWPLAGVIAAGHLLARSKHNQTLREFGEALESA